MTWISSRSRWLRRALPTTEGPSNARNMADNRQRRWQQRQYGQSGGSDRGGVFSSRRRTGRRAAEHLVEDLARSSSRSAAWSALPSRCPVWGALWVHRWRAAQAASPILFPCLSRPRRAVQPASMAALPASARSAKLPKELHSTSTPPMPRRWRQSSGTSAANGVTAVPVEQAGVAAGRAPHDPVAAGHSRRAPAACGRRCRIIRQQFGGAGLCSSGDRQLVAEPPLPRGHDVHTDLHRAARRRPSGVPYLQHGLALVRRRKPVLRPRAAGSRFR
jgi:hypothetical protein